MTDEQLIAIAKEAHFSGVRTVWHTVTDCHQTLHNTNYRQLADFARIVTRIATAQERQRCAAIARNYPFSPNVGIGIAESIIKEDTK